MKFLSSFLIAVFILSAGIVNAQTDSEADESKSRIAELLSIGLSATSGIEDLDNFVEAVQSASDESVSISKSLDSMTQRMDEGSNIPSITEVTELSTRVNGLVSSTTEASKLSVDAVKSLKEVKKNPLKIASATKTLNNAKDALEIIVKESTYQVKTVSSLLKAVAK